MANTSLTRPVVTMNLANRSIGRFGLLANRVMHPLVASRFGREVGMFSQNSNLKIVPSKTGISVQTTLGETSIKNPLYAKLFGKAGIIDIGLPKGTSAGQIEDLFKTVAVRSSFLAKKILGDTLNLTGQEDLLKASKPWEDYFAPNPYLPGIAKHMPKINSVIGATVFAVVLGTIGYLANRDFITAKEAVIASIVGLPILGAVGAIMGQVILPTLEVPILHLLRGEFPFIYHGEKMVHIGTAFDHDGLEIDGYDELQQYEEVRFRKRHLDE